MLPVVLMQAAEVALQKLGEAAVPVAVELLERLAEHRLPPEALEVLKKIADELAKHPEHMGDIERVAVAAAASAAADAAVAALLR